MICSFCLEIPYDNNMTLNKNNTSEVIFTCGGLIEPLTLIKPNAPDY